MENIKDLVDVNVVIGNTVESPDGTVIIPVSRVSFGFAAGGSDYNVGSKADESASYPFGGGSGAGVSVKPIGFLVCVKGGDVRFLPVESNNFSTYDRVVDIMPKVIDKIEQLLDKRAASKNKAQNSDLPAEKK